MIVKYLFNMLKNITINKRKEVKAATHPTHDIVASDENYQNKAIVGAMWTRTAKDEMGNDYKFLSGTFSKTRTHEGKEYDGYVLITEKEWNEYQSLKNEVKLPEVKVDIPDGSVDISDLPF